MYYTQNMKKALETEKKARTNERKKGAWTFFCVAPTIEFDRLLQSSVRKRWCRRTLDQSFRFHCWFMHCIQIRWASIDNRYSQTANESCYSQRTIIHRHRQTSTHTHTHIEFQGGKCIFAYAKIWTHRKYALVISSMIWLRFDWIQIRLSSWPFFLWELLNKCEKFLSLYYFQHQSANRFAREVIRIGKK